ncbi:MAG: hypothetical protein AAFO82_11705, partial [Bacteroidota bacterium]
TATVQASKSQICSNERTALFAEGGTQFLWSTGETSSSITVGPGTYQVTVSNGMGCEDQTSFTVDRFPDFEAEIIGTSPICAGTTTDLSIEVGQSFQWNNGSNSNTITVGAGNYEVLVTDENGCQVNSQFDVTYFEEFEAEITGEDQICEGGISTLVASPGESYLWSTGETTQSINVEAGQYSVTVIDANACQAGANFTVNEISILEAEISGENRICEGERTLLTATIGSSYTWSTGETTRSIEVGAGNYSVTITSAGGCEANNSIQVLSSPRPSFSIVNSANCNPSLESYQITINTPLSNTFTSNAKVLERDNNGNYLIEVPTAQDLEFSIESETGCFISERIPAPDCSCPTLAAPPSNGDQEICEGEAFPTLSVGVAESNLTINWYDAIVGGNLIERNSAVFKPTTAGTYYAEVVNEISNCRSVRTPISFTINQLPEIDRIETQNINCNDDFGSITVIGTGEHLPYEYAINNGAFSTDNNFSDLPEGRYLVSIRNSKACVDEFSAEIKVEQRFDEQTITQYSCNTEEIGTETIRLTNSLGCDSIINIVTLDGRSDTLYLAATTCDPDQATIEKITLSNQHGCDSLIITEYTLVQSDTTYIDVTSCNPEDVGQTFNTFKNQNGCDSIVVTRIEYAEENRVFLEATSCNPDDLGIDTSYYTNQFGCDSIVIMETTLQGTGDSPLTFFRKMTCDFGRLGFDTTHYQNQH